MNSTPQLLACDRCAVAQLGPAGLRLGAAAATAVGAGDDVFSVGDFSERDEAIGYQFRVLDEGTGDRLPLLVLHKLK